MAFFRKNSIIESQEKHIFHLLFYSFVHSSHFPWKLEKKRSIPCLETSSLFFVTHIKHKIVYKSTRNSSI